MTRIRFSLAAAMMIAAPLAAQDKPALAPAQIAAAAPKADWVAIPAADLLVMDLAPDAKGRSRRVVIQLMPPPFSQGWVGNVRKLAAAHWWDGLAVTRVQDNYVAQWGDPDGEDKAKPLPAGLAQVPESDYAAAYAPGLLPYVLTPAGQSPAELSPIVAVAPGAITARVSDAFADTVGFKGGFPVGLAYPKPGANPFLPLKPEAVWPVHCYGMVGVGRNMSPDTGSGAELYTVIGHAPRHLDRNIALVGRVIEGIEHLSSLPRGTGPLGVYETRQEQVPIVSIRPGGEVAGLPAYEYLSTESASFAKYADARANRRDPFFIRPAGGVDICNIPVPVRRAQ